MSTTPDRRFLSVATDRRWLQPEPFKGSMIWDEERNEYVRGDDGEVLAFATPFEAQQALIGVLVEHGHEVRARASYGDRCVDDWFRADGVDPDVARGHTLEEAADQERVEAVAAEHGRPFGEGMER